MKEVKNVIVEYGFKAKLDIEEKKEGKWYVIIDKKSNVATQAKTKKEARKRFVEALSLYYEEFMPKISIKAPSLSRKPVVVKIKEEGKKYASLSTPFSA